ncbi:NADH dehydrogenase [ubiquinone] 1 subunit C2 [Eublepharis macularius]|uniref:NADH dehydrogenase [ubiquinone] 1 subunit C2 n=1 Tax=Eublepharis macularius TaxID=481883 RepID=A0AA97J0R9_EUBMA|nr:NADH dehydrogenase [ubiquinone] 1 subunit C2 [Eublepharis macularius]
MGRELFVRLPDEARSLPPPPLFNFGSVYVSFMGWCSALVDNALRNRPILGTGVHRQLFWASVGFYIGYYLTRRADYFDAKRDQEMAEYIRHHSEDFKMEKKRTMAEVLENFRPVR